MAVERVVVSGCRKGGGEWLSKGWWYTKMMRVYWCGVVLVCAANGACGFDFFASLKAGEA